MKAGNELIELYDCLSVLYAALPEETDPEWKLALQSVLHGGELLADGASCYGAQQKNRNRGTREEYVRQYGDESRITEFSATEVAAPRGEDARYLPAGAVVPVAPVSGEVLPVMVSSSEVDRAISLLAEFPAEPAADRPGSGVGVLLDPDRVRRARETMKHGGGDGETTVLFVSDTHLGYEKRAATGSGKAVSWIDEVSSIAAFTRVVTIAVDLQVDAVIHTGDILDHEVDRETLARAESLLEVLSLLGISVYCIIGSHDRTSYAPQDSGSVNGIDWLQTQVARGHLVELSTDATPVAGGPVDAYGIPDGGTWIDDVAQFNQLGWDPADIVFGPGSPGPNILCLHDSVTPYREEEAGAIDLDALLAQSSVSFDCVLVGDEHHPKHDDFETGYSFEAADGTPVYYTGPTIRISGAYAHEEPFVTEFRISSGKISVARHTV